VEKMRNKYQFLLGIPYKALFDFAFMVSFVALEKYDKAIDFVNRLDSYDKTRIRKDLIPTKNAINLIIHYELNNRAFLASLIQNAKFYFNKKEKFLKTEKTIAVYIGKLLKTINKTEQTSLFKELHLRLLEYRVDPFEENAFDYFDYISWAESHLCSKKFNQLVKEKFAKKYSNHYNTESE